MKSAVKARNPLAMGEVGAGVGKPSGKKRERPTTDEEEMAVPDEDAMGGVARLLSEASIDDEDADGEVDLDTLVRESATNGELREVYKALILRCQQGDAAAITAYMKIATPILQTTPKKIEELDEDAVKFIESFTATVKGVAGGEEAHPDLGAGAGAGSNRPQPAAEKAEETGHPTAEPAV